MVSNQRNINLVIPTKSEETCGFCGTVWNYVKKCAQCGIIAYCDKMCQKQDWNDHKKKCKEFKNKPKNPNNIPITELEKKTPLDVTKIPDDVWFQIFGFLSTKDIIKGEFMVLLENI